MKFIKITILILIIVLLLGKLIIINAYSYESKNNKYINYIQYINTKINIFEKRNVNKSIRLNKFIKIKNILLNLNLNLSGVDDFKYKILIKIISNKIEQYKDEVKKTSFKRIAHAGGIYNGYIYTNSIDALNYNKNYYNLFELDFSWTKDAKLVCIHDWGGSFYNNFGFKLNGNIPTYKKFIHYVNNNIKYKNCTLKSLIKWLDDNPEKYIITDIKSNNTKGLKYIAENYPYYINRFIPQIYYPNNYEEIKSYGYNNIIWTLYKYSKDNYIILQFLNKFDLYALTMPLERVYSNLSIKVKKMNNSIYIYTHTINSYDKFNYLKKIGIDEIYTDKMMYK